MAAIRSTMGSSPATIGPGGNVTGVTIYTKSFVVKLLELLHKLIPNASVMAVLSNPSNTTAEQQLNVTKAAAQALGLQLIVVEASTEREIDNAFAEIVRQRAAALFIGADAFFRSQQNQIVALAARPHRIPASFSNREFVEAGGLMSFAPSIHDAYRQAGAYVGRILKGEKPADLRDATGPV